MDFSVLLTDLPTLVIVIIGVPAVLAAYIVGGEYLVRQLPDKARPAVRPWIWVAPALVLVSGFLVAPAVGTVISSFEDNKGNFVGFTNFGNQLAGFPTGGAWIAIRDNLFWLVFYTLFVLAFGLLLAVLFDRVPYESVVKSLIFMPMAISSVALVVIWKFMYAYQPPGQPQTGTLNFILNTVFHQDPRTWVQDETAILGLIPLNNLALIAAAVWGIVGFSMVILSAALKGIPADLLEAARVDGAGQWRTFWKVTFPLLRPIFLVLALLSTIWDFGMFTQAYIVTGNLGNRDEYNLGLYEYSQAFTQPPHYGLASAAAFVLTIILLIVTVGYVRAAIKQGSLA